MVPAPTAWALADHALLEVVAGKPEQAERLFLRAAEIGGARDPRLRSDVCAFYLTRASRPDDGRASDPLRALEACEAALAVRPALLEAIYNKSLALEMLDLRHEAASTWQRYLSLDPASQWSGLAQRHLVAIRRALLRVETEKHQLERGLVLSALGAGAGVEIPGLMAIVSTRPDVARLYGLEILLGRWAFAKQREQTRLAMRLLAAAHGIGTALARAHGDLLLLDSVTVIEAAAAQPPTLDSLVRGHALFAEALSLEKQESFAAAGRGFEAASKALRQARSPFAPMATLHLGVCQYYRARYDEALASIAAAAAQLDPVRHPAEVGYGFWMSGLVRYVMADLQHALSDHRLALERFTLQREPPHVAFVAAFIAGDLYGLGRREESWGYRRRSLAGVSQLSDPRRVYSVLMTAAEAALGDQQLASARVFMSELIDSLDAGASHGLLAEALARRGVLEEQTQDLGAAMLDIARARAHLLRVADPYHRNRVAADLDLAEGRILHAHDPWRAIALLDRAQVFFDAAGFQINSGQALRERAAAYRGSARPHLAERDLEEAIAGYERHRQELPSESARMAYFEQVQGILDDMMRLQMVDLRRPDSAFLYAERSRARALLDRVQALDRAWPSATTSLTDLASRLPPGARIIEFAVLEDQTIAWTVARDTTTAILLAVGAASLADTAHRFREQILAGEVDPPAGRELYSLLIAPLRRSLEPGSTLVFVPDKSLNGVPFAALRDPATGRFLLEDFSIAVSPSAALYLHSLARGLGLLPVRRRSLLLVEGDGFDRRTFASLAPLAGAGREIGFLAAVYRQVTVLAGGAATKERVLRALGTTDIAQISAHAALQLGPVGAVGLVLAPPSGTDRDSARSSRSAAAPGESRALLGAVDIQASALRRLRLVVLAACGSAVGAATTREGSLSVARGFLAAGVPAVVATLWNIDDQASTAFFRAFHQRLANGAEPLAALRATQLGYLRQSTPVSPEVWAAYELIGGVADRAVPAL